MVCIHIHGVYLATVLLLPLLLLLLSVPTCSCLESPSSSRRPGALGARGGGDRRHQHVAVRGGGGAVSRDRCLRGVRPLVADPIHEVGKRRVALHRGQAEEALKVLRPTAAAAGHMRARSQSAIARAAAARAAGTAAAATRERGGGGGAGCARAGVCVLVVVCVCV
jgi:hypothetical protein